MVAMKSTVPFSILCVDDNDDNRISLASILRFEGYNVCEASNGSDALRLAREVDLAVLDVRLPDVSGLHVCQQIKANPATDLVSVILLSGIFTHSNNRAEGLENGADAYFVKPVEPRELLGQIKALLRIRQTELVLQQHARIIDHIHEAVIAFDLDGHVTRWNQGAERLFGYSARDMLGAHVGKLYPSEERERILEQIFAEVRRRGAHETEERMRRRSGDELIVHTALSLLYDSRGEAAGIIGYSIDTTGRRRAEAALKASEERYRQIVETAAEGIWIVDSKCRTTFVNDRMVTMLGSTVADVSQRCILDFTDDEGKRCLQELVLEHPAESVQQHEFRFYRQDGSKFWAFASTNALRPEAGQDFGALIMITDITERKRLEEQFRQSQKMEAIGRLAGGIAHDFNNLLTVINGCSELVLQRLSRDDPTSELVRQIREAGDRAAALTRQLLAFSRKTILEAKILDLNQVMSRLESMLFRLIGEDIELVATLDPHLEKIKVDAGQLEQAVVNLIVNARDAMPQGGRISVETRNVDLTDLDIDGDSDFKPGSYVLLTIADNGVGMGELTKAQVFEPFFTTKGPGKGTGLGLAMVYGFVKQSGGHIQVDSELGKGTTFRLYFHKVAEPIPARATPTVLDPPKGGSETILVVEDEDRVRALVCNVLKLSGYAVLSAGDGVEALKIAEAHPGQIDLLLTDVVMPLGIGGRQVAEGVRKLYPQIAVLFMSGYTDDAVMRQGKFEADTHFLQKPFGPSVLSQKIREILDSVRRGASA